MHEGFTHVSRMLHGGFTDVGRMLDDGSTVGARMVGYDSNNRANAWLVQKLFVSLHKIFRI